MDISKDKIVKYLKERFSNLNFHNELTIKAYNNVLNKINKDMTKLMIQDIFLCEMVKLLFGHDELLPVLKHVLTSYFREYLYTHREYYINETLPFRYGIFISSIRDLSAYLQNNDIKENQSFIKLFTIFLDKNFEKKIKTPNNMNNSKTLNIKSISLEEHYKEYDKTAIELLLSLMKGKELELYKKKFGNNLDGNKNKALSVNELSDFLLYDSYNKKKLKIISTFRERGQSDNYIIKVLSETDDKILMIYKNLDKYKENTKDKSLEKNSKNNKVADKKYVKEESTKKVRKVKTEKQQPDKNSKSNNAKEVRKRNNFLTEYFIDLFVDSNLDKEEKDKKLAIVLDIFNTQNKSTYKYVITNLYGENLDQKKNNFELATKEYMAVWGIVKSRKKMFK